MAKKEYTAEEICRDIKARQFAPVYLLMGEEPFFIDRITNLLIDTVLNESERDFNQSIFYGADTDATTVIHAARKFPMMSDYQLVVLKEAQLLRDIDLVANYVKKPQPSTVLVINYKYKSLDRRRALAVAAEKNGLLFESKKIPDYRMPTFIASLLKERSIDIDAKSAQMLTDALGNDLNRLCQELDKLSLLLPKNGPQRISPEMVEHNVGISKEYNNFELLKALALKDLTKAYRIIRFFAQNPKNHPIQASLPILFNFFANLLICHYAKDHSDSGLMNTLGLRSAFQVKDYQSGLRNYSALKVFRIINDIRNADARSKGVANASLSDADLMNELIYKLLH